MSSTNKTAKLALSQFLGTDKPAWLGDYNSDMQKIDDAFANLEQGGQSSAADIAVLQQKDEELTQNINDVNDRVDTAFADVITLGNRTTVLEGNYDTMHHELVLNGEKIEETREVVDDNTKSIDKLTGNAPVIYIDPISGNDSNDGLSENTAIKTVTQFYKIAMKYRNVQLSIKAGTTLNITNNLTTNILSVKSYGTGDKPIFKCVNASTFLAFNYGCTFNNISIDTDGKYLQISARRFETMNTAIKATGRIDFKGMIKIYTNTTVTDASIIELSEGVLTGLNYLPNPSNFKLTVSAGIAILPTFGIGTVTVNGGVAIKTGTYTV